MGPLGHTAPCLEKATLSQLDAVPALALLNQSCLQCFTPASGQFPPASAFPPLQAMAWVVSLLKPDVIWGSGKQPEHREGYLNGGKSLEGTSVRQRPGPPSPVLAAQTFALRKRSMRDALSQTPREPSSFCPLMGVGFVCFPTGAKLLRVAERERDHQCQGEERRLTSR